MESSRLSLPAAAVALGLLLLTLLAALAVDRAIDRREDQALDNLAVEVATLVDRRTDTYAEKLFGLRGLFSGSTNVSPRDYEQFLASQELIRRLPTIRAVSFVEYLRDDQRAAYERRRRREMAASRLPYPPFEIRPSFSRPAYAVITYVHPLVERNVSAIGADLLTLGARQVAIERARDTGRITAPLPLRLVQDPLDLSVVLFLPVYRGANQQPAAAARQERFLGVVTVAVRLRDLLSDLPRADSTTVKLYDDGLAGTVRTPRLLFAQRNAPDDARSRTLPLDTAGRRWRLEYATGAPLVGALERTVPAVIVGMGLVFSLLAGAFVHSLTVGRRNALADLERNRRELQRSNEELERFAFLASHDLQQPLRTVSGFLQLLVHQQGDRLDARAREYVEHALRGTRQMSSLIGDLLAYSRVARDDRPLEPVALDEVWDRAVEQVRATIDEAGASVTRGDLPVVAGDRGQFTQVFANLIGNGVKYRGEAQPVVRAEARQVNGGWEIAVKDNGMGIDPQDHDRIFEMFRRLHADDDIEGTGVGLALAKRIVERSGGQIHVESEPGAGSRFVLRLQPPADTVEGGDRR
jgi:signal transduction histidine kinase